MSDIVAELDRAIAEPFGWHTAIMQRARDEIMMLREMREAHIRMLMANNDDARNDALEEAARRCDRLATDYTIPVSADNWSDGCRGCAGRIRALKYKP